ncbi:L,D-transpeptidase family protein [Streptomyces sp. 796.1]|uniref:L,D-transpeptidase family protein n=1 Tax=Streptomyces sp. 796.1 TaxID=3163029 RepID=UPI0039C9FB1E
MRRISGPVLRGALAALAAAAVTTAATGCEPETIRADGTRSPSAAEHRESPSPHKHREHRTPKRTHTPEPARTTPRTHRPSPPPRTHRPTPPAHRTWPTRPAKPAQPPVLAAGASGAKVRELQARLRQLGHFQLQPTGYYGTVTSRAVAAFQRGHARPVTGTLDTKSWSKLRDLTDEPSRAAMYPPTTRPVAKPDARCMTGRTLCISKSSRTLSWMINGKVIASMDVRFGSQYTPTREGTFKVDFKSRDHVSTIYDSPMPYAMFFSGGQAVHYSSDFAARGYNGASHGCVNVRDKKKIAAVFDQVKAGDKVVVYR